MADEESEVRRMAEIADAINAILEAEPTAIGDTPSQSAPSDVVSDDAPQAAEAPAAASDALDDELDVAIANEFAAELAEAEQETPQDTYAETTNAPFGPVPELNLPRADTANASGDETIRPGSGMADLSMRMRETLAEIRSQSSAAWAGADDLLAEMEAARASLVANIREQIGQIEQATQARRQAVSQQLEELESQSLMARDEMEMMLVKYEASLAEMHDRYFQNAQSERERLGRYREFLQFLLDERGI